MLKVTKALTMNGTSVVKIARQDIGEDAEVSVASMNATIGNDGRISVSTNIHNKEVYEENKQEVIEDIQEFQNAVYSMDTITEAE